LVQLWQHRSRPEMPGTRCTDVRRAQPGLRGPGLGDLCNQHERIAVIHSQFNILGVERQRTGWLQENRWIFRRSVKLWLLDLGIFCVRDDALAYRDRCPLEAAAEPAVTPRFAVIYIH